MAEIGWDFVRRSLQMAAMAMGSMAAIVTAWLALGLPTLATREYVNDQITVLKMADAETVKTVHSIQIDILSSRKQNVEGDIFAQEQALKTKPGDADVARRLRMLRDQLEELTQEITTLRQGH